MTALSLYMQLNLFSCVSGIQKSQLFKLQEWNFNNPGQVTISSDDNEADDMGVQVRNIVNLKINEWTNVWVKYKAPRMHPGRARIAKEALGLSAL